MTTTVADVMVATLKASGVRRIYGIPGDSLNGFTDALRRDGDIAWEHVRHEEAAGFAAAAEAALTGSWQCARATRAGQPAPDQRAVQRNRSRVPVRAIAAQTRGRNRRGSFSRSPPAGAVRECRVYWELASIPPGPAGRRGRRHRRRTAAAERRQGGQTHLDRMTAHYRRARAAGQTGPGPAERLAAAPAVRGGHDRQAGRRRRGVRRRRRRAVHLGRPVLRMNGARRLSAR